MNSHYDVHADAIIQRLIAEAAADPDVIGLVLTGSRAAGMGTPESDYDAIFVMRDEAFARRKQAQTLPARGTTVAPPPSILPTFGTRRWVIWRWKRRCPGCYLPTPRR